ncbi:pyridoxamine 5'-phosphate oxidase family protein [Ramlibacter solisilvae]|uniref:General stress protein n=1 Tax=Ramlibacter tataouinensis TaxID=94132 RepID=A0A127JPX9_9BURK|nr:pyridoxamine 5'-phosphate oxidase family protein [Ramlibacter tataouinensis]AMO22051.1 general stress protein [Ramlibacter tataouinensis]
MTTSPDPHKKLWDLIKHMRFGMLTHSHPGGLLHAHPLTTQNKSLEPDMALYFFVSKKTELGKRLRADGNVNVAYADPRKDTYVSVSGQASISEDQRLKEHLFNALSRAWFPGGAGDPDLELVQVKIAYAEYWDITESKTTQLFKLATAAVTGHPPQLGEHRQLQAH